MIIGAILQATSFSYAQLVVARIITGLGNGLNVSDPCFPYMTRAPSDSLLSALF